MEIEVNYLQVIVQDLVKNEFSIDRSEDDKGVLLTMNVAKQDMGRVIGKGGETITAIRRLVRQVGSENGLHVSVKLNEPV